MGRRAAFLISAFVCPLVLVVPSTVSCKPQLSFAMSMSVLQIEMAPVDELVAASDAGTPSGENTPSSSKAVAEDDCETKSGDPLESK